MLQVNVLFCNESKEIEFINYIYIISIEKNKTRLIIKIVFIEIFFG